MPVTGNAERPMHGGRSPGAPRGSANGNYKTGLYTCEVIEERRQLAAWIRAMGQLAKDVE